MPKDVWNIEKSRRRGGKTTRRMRGKRYVYINDTVDKCVSEANEIRDFDFVFWFGKKKGQTIREVFETDPGYIEFISKHERVCRRERNYRMITLKRFLRQALRWWKATQHRPFEILLGQGGIVTTFLPDSADFLDMSTGWTTHTEK